MKSWHLPSLLIRRPVLMGLLGFLLALGIQVSFLHVDRERRAEAEKSLVQAQVSSVRARLESELNTTLSLSLGVSSFILGKPDFTEQDFRQVAAALVRIRPGIRSVALAPDNVIRHVYPMEGNARALGLRYLDTPTQRDAVLRLMREQRPVIAGPVELVQGGMGIINRIPVLFTRADGSTRYWGLASVAVDPQPIYQQAGLLDRDGQILEFALRGRDGLGARGEVFLGQAALFDDPRSVLMDVVIPGGSWQLAARTDPAMQAKADGPRSTLLLLLALSVAGLFGLMVHSTLAAHHRMHGMALRDSLTGLANRHQFNLRGANLFALAKRSGRHLTLLNMDLNDFKLINDTRGHAVGDQVLIHVAGQLRQCFRESDLVARVGGDEFLALLPDTSTGPSLDGLLHRLREAVNASVPGLDPPVRASICIGVATCTDQTATLDDLMRLADEAMYQAKIREKYGMGQA
ncbi:MAG: diguanylate cyclase [Pseudomonadota bacterium]